MANIDRDLTPGEITMLKSVFGNTITYSYASGGTFAYTVQDPTNTLSLNPGTFTFIGASTFSITVATAHCF